MANEVKFNINIKSKQAISQLKALQRLSAKVRKDFERLDIVLKRITNTQLKASKATIKLMGAQTKLKTAETKLAKAVNSATKARTKSNKTKKKSIPLISRLTKSMTLGVTAGNLLSSAIKSVGRGILAAGLGAVKASSLFEKLQVQFSVLTQDTRVAKDLFQDLVEFSAKTPFRLKDIAGASQKLLAFGFDASEVKVQIRRLGDVAGATGSDLGEISRILGQIKSKGNLTGERNLQLLERGIVLYPELAKVMNVSEGALEKLQKQGKITFESVNQALVNLTSKGGAFFQGTIKLAKTAAGVWSTVQDNIELVGASLGDKLLPFLKFAGIQVIKMLSSFRKWADSNLTVAKTFTFINKGLEIFVLGATTVVDTIAFVKKAFVVIQGVFETFVLGLTKVVSAGILPFTLAASKLGKAMGKNTQGLDDFNKGLEDLRNVEFGDILKDKADKIDRIGTSTKKTTDTIRKGIKDLSTDLTKFAFDSPEETTAPGKTKGSKDDGSNEEKLKATKKYLEEKQRLIKEAALRETEFIVAREIEAGVRQETRLGMLIADLGKEEAIKYESRLRLSENQRQTNLINLELDVATSARKLELLNEESKNRIETEKNVAKIIEDIQKESRKRDEENRQASLQGTASMFSGLASLTAVGGKRLFKITKAFNLAEAITSGILAVQKAAASAPPPFNIPAIIGATATSAANVARISAQKPPAFEQGGIIPGASFSGDNTIARVNPGEMILNQQQQKQMFNQLNSGQSSSTNVNSTVVVELDGEVVGRAVSKQVANGLQLGEVV